MDKLTWYDEDGRLYCRRGYEVALARLASYEATELMPDEIVKMGMMFEDSKRYSGRLELKLNAATKRMPKWVSVKERLPEDRSDVLVVAYWQKDGASIWAGALPKGRNGASMSVSEIEAMLQLSIGCRCLRRRRRTTEMIDTGDLTMYCHWGKGLVCKKEFYCDTCEHQPAADDKENGKAEPVHIRWAEDYWSGRYPECPSCGNMPYSLERCVFCGQRFLPDALTEEWSKPPEEVRMDCPSCGGKSTMVGARARSNGHFHGRCTACGCVVME